MAVKRSVQQTPIISQPKRSGRKMSFKEFSLESGLSREFLAGFKVYLQGIEYLSPADWDKTLREYKNRNYV